MVKEFNEKWVSNKDKLEAKLLTLQQNDVDEYEKLLKLVIEIIFNADDEHYWKKVDASEITKIDFGDYQGTLIFVYHEDTYQPSTHETFYTSVEYGSCSGCDTLLNILEWIDYKATLSESQVKDLMTLCLHMVENTYRFKDYFEETIHDEKEN